MAKDVRHARTRGRPRGYMLVFLAALVLASCATSPVAGDTSRGNSAAPTTPPANVFDASCAIATPAPPAPPAQPPTITPSTWTTYINTAYHYHIAYPSNWIILGNTADSPSFLAYNFDPNKLTGADEVPASPYDKIEVDALPNPGHLSAANVFARNQAPNGSQPPACSVSTSPMRVAGQQALLVVQHPVRWTLGVVDKPSLSFWVPDGDTVLIIAESSPPGGTPSDVLRHMLASLIVSS